MITVAIKAITEPDEQDNPVTPEVGDTLDIGGVQVKVKSITGETATLVVQSINGEPVTYGDAPAGAAPEPGTDEMRKHLISSLEATEEA